MSIFMPLMFFIVTTNPTYGLPPCAGNTNGLTERYEMNTLYVDLCEDGVVMEKNLQSLI